LADRQGWAVFIGTPKGRNTFADLYERAEADPDWYSLRLRASETGIIPASELAAMKVELSANEYRREMETDFDAAVEGAYFAEQLHAAQTEGRISTLATDPILQVRAFWDLGVSDSTAIWIAQWQGQTIKWLDYIEGAGQPLGYYVDQMRRRGWENAKCILPHDGAQRDAVTATRFEDHLTAAGFQVETMPNQGKGASMKRIEAARRLFPRMWFDVEKTSDGRRALAAYHEKRDEKRMIGLGPMHDWASHGADAFGLGCVAYEEPKMKSSSRLIVPNYAGA
jgi:phage terminase large subunit